MELLFSSDRFDFVAQNSFGSVFPSILFLTESCCIQPAVFSRVAKRSSQWIWLKVNGLPRAPNASANHWRPFRRLPCTTARWILGTSGHSTQAEDWSPCSWLPSWRLYSVKGQKHLMTRGYTADYVFVGQLYWNVKTQVTLRTPTC